MNKQTTKILVPKLRFPEFQDAEEWVKKPLGKVAEIITGNTPSTTESSNYVGNKMFVSPADISEDRYITRTKTTLSDNGYSQTRHVKENSVLFVCIGSTIGKVAQNKFECATNQQINSIVPYEGYSSDFIYSTLENDSSRIASIAGIHAIPIINKSVFSSVLVNFPTPEEQQKIADCLSSIDDLIHAQGQKLDTLKVHKNGLIQRLFPAEGETVPKFRFEEFKDAGEWKVIKLIDVTDKKTKWSFIGGPFGSNLKSSDYVSDGIRIIQLQNIGDAKFNDEYKIFTSEEKADELLSCNIYPGDIILSKMGDPVGRACLIPNKHARYVMCSDGIRLVVDEKRFCKYFVYSLINSAQFRALVEKSATGSTRKRIGLDDLKDLSMVVPNKLKEQQKIADCLSSIDELITAQIQKLDALKVHKKGLMQQLFPGV